MAKEEAKTNETTEAVKQEDTGSKKPAKKFNFIRHGIVIEAPNRREAEKLLEEQLKSKKDK